MVCQCPFELAVIDAAEGQWRQRMDGRPIPTPAPNRAKFSGEYAHRSISGGVGHNLPQEAPRAFAQAVADVDRY